MISQLDLFPDNQNTAGLCPAPRKLTNRQEGDWWVINQELTAVEMVIGQIWTDWQSWCNHRHYDLLLPMSEWTMDMHSAYFHAIDSAELPSHLAKDPDALAMKKWLEELATLKQTSSTPTSNI